MRIFLVFAALHCDALHYTTLQCTITTLHYTALHSTALNCTALYYHYTSLHGNALYCTALHQNEKLCVILVATASPTRPIHKRESQ